MKYLKYLVLFAFILQGCQNNKSKQSNKHSALKDVTETLGDDNSSDMIDAVLEGVADAEAESSNNNKSVNSEYNTTAKAIKKYVFTFINYKTRFNSLPAERKCIWTSIEESYLTLSEDEEYRKMDALESRIRPIPGESLSITSRKVYSFDSYAAASKMLQKLKR